MCRLPLLVCVLVLLSVVARAQVLVSDNFSDNLRNNQGTGSPLTSLNWLYSSNTGGPAASAATAASGALVTTQSSTPKFISFTGYFTPSGSPRALADGETITLSFSLKLSSNADINPNDILVGLFNSGGTRLSADAPTSTNATTTAYNTTRGYFAGFNGSSTASDLTIFEHIDADVASGTAVTTASRTALSTTSGAPSTTAGTAFSVSFSIARTASTYSLITNVNGTIFTASDTSISASGFDTVILQFGSNVVPASGTITLDNIQVAITSAVPEPSTYAISAAVFVLGFSLVARRRRK